MQIRFNSFLLSWATRPRLVAIGLAVTAGLGACSSVDLNQKAGPPTCAISTADYLMLHRWNDRTADKPYVKIIADLEKKYASAPPVDGRSAVVAAQGYVRLNKELTAPQIQAALKSSCVR